MTRRTSLFVAAASLVLGAAAVAPFQPANAAQEKKAAAATFEVYKDKAGEFRWRLRARNSNIIATSGEGYSAKRDCLAGIESVRKDAVDAPVEEEKKG